MSRTPYYSTLLSIIVIAILYGSGGSVAGKWSPPIVPSGLTAPFSSAGTAATKSPRILVPAYFDPVDNSQTWSDLINAGQNVRIIAIANPNDGPGPSFNQSYKDIIDQAHKAGIAVVGYVLTNEGKGSVDDVRRDIDKWLAFYPNINGIFFDEQSQLDDKGKVDFYKNVFAYARKKIKNSLIISNPGGAFPERYISEAKADITCIYEDEQGFDTFSMPTWTAKYSPERFAVLLHKVKDRQLMESYLDRAVKLRIGNVYVTDDQLSNPWDSLPSYWSSEVSKVKALKK